MRRPPPHGFCFSRPRPPSLSLPAPSSRESPQPEPALGDRAPWGRGSTGVDGRSGFRRPCVPDQVDAPGRREGPRGVGRGEEDHLPKPGSGRAQTLVLRPGDGCLPAACEPSPRERTPLRGADACPSSPQISVPGHRDVAVLPGLQSHLEYEITILAYYRDGARSDPVSLRYTPRR